MRRFAASSLAAFAAAAMAALACGGPEFVLGASRYDASATDAESDVADGADDLVSEASDSSLDARRLGDARPRDGSDAEPPADGPRVADASDASTEAGDAAVAHCAAGLACVPAVPTGWAGPFELSTASGATTPPTCGANFDGQVLDGRQGLSAAPATCGCLCGAATGVQCTVPAVPFYATMATCTLAASCTSLTLRQGICAAVNVSQACGSILGTTMSPPPSVASAGSCSPFVASTVPAATWAATARACGASLPLAKADCAAGSVCAPAPSSPFQSALCIEQTGDVGCPASGYTVKALIHQGIDDTRGCSACTCGAVTGASCSGNITQFASTDGGCTAPQIVYPLGQTCDPLQQPADLELTATATGGSCASSPVSPVGAATPSQPLTLCCL